jgi:hypothetical protein
MVAEPVPGPDGFLISPDDRLRAEHLRLNDYLLAEEQRSPQTAFDVAIWRKLAKRHFADQIQAVLRQDEGRSTQQARAPQDNRIVCAKFQNGEFPHFKADSVPL